MKLFIQSYIIGMTFFMWIISIYKISICKKKFKHGMLDWCLLIIAALISILIIWIL